MHHQQIHHHIHQSKIEKSSWLKRLDSVCLVFSILMPATAIPQIIKIYTTQDVTGLSLLMWVLYSIGVIPFFIYGIVHKETPLIVLNTLWLIVQSIIIIGILLYQ